MDLTLLVDALWEGPQTQCDLIIEFLAGCGITEEERNYSSDFDPVVLELVKTSVALEKALKADDPDAVLLLSTQAEDVIQQVVDSLAKEELAEDLCVLALETDYADSLDEAKDHVQARLEDLSSYYLLLGVWKPFGAWALIKTSEASEKEDLSRKLRFAASRVRREV